LFINDVIVTRR